MPPEVIARAFEAFFTTKEPEQPSLALHGDSRSESNLICPRQPLTAAKRATRSS
jgi:hypothetical protein